MQCTIVDCAGNAFANGLCVKHYWRQRRTGNPAVKGKPGPKPGPQPVVLSAAEAIELARLRQENPALRRENTVLRRQVAMLERQRTQARGTKPKRPKSS